MLHTSHSCHDSWQKSSLSTKPSIFQWIPAYIFFNIHFLVSSLQNIMDCGLNMRMGWMFLRERGIILMCYKELKKVRIILIITTQPLITSLHVIYPLIQCPQYTCHVNAWLRKSNKVDLYSFHCLLSGCSFLSSEFFYMSFSLQ